MSIERKIGCYDTETLDERFERFQDAVMIDLASSSGVGLCRENIYHNVFSVLENLLHGVENAGHRLTCMTLKDLYAIHESRIRFLTVLEQMKQGRLSKSAKNRVTQVESEIFIAALEEFRELVNKEIIKRGANPMMNL